MINSLPMQDSFERQKNTQATVYTALIAGALLLIALWVKMTIPQPDLPIQESVIDVELPNLGSGDQGMGTDQPYLPGDPAPAEQAQYTPPQPTQAREEAVKDVADDKETSDAPPVVKPAVSKPEATKINAPARVVKTTNTNPQPVATPAPPRPRAVMGRVTGGNGTGGNGADTYKPGGNEGIAGGHGDQGRVGGDPNSRNYSGSPRNFGRRAMTIPDQAFVGDFNEPNKVAIDIIVDPNGKVTSATFQQKGSTTSERRYVEIARRSAFELKMGAVEGGQKGTIVFNFKVKQ